MAQLKFTRWSKLVLKVGNNASPQVFTPLCTINGARSITFTANVSEDAIPDCDDLQKVQWLVREKVSLSADVSGAGRVDKANIKTFVDWLTGEDTKTCQVILDDDDPDNIVTFEGEYHCTNFAMTGDPGAPTVTGDISLQSSGEITADYGANVGGT